MPPVTSVFFRSVGTTSHYKSYQLECPTCRSVAAFHARADLLQPHMDRILPRSLSLYESANELTLKQRVAVDWSFAISKCLRRGMAFHARCGRCTILMGPGHAESGLQGFCGTHSERAASIPPVLGEAPSDALGWLDGNATRATPNVSAVL